MTTYLIQSFVYLLYVSTYHSLHYTALGTIQILRNHWTRWVGSEHAIFCLLSVHRGWVGQKKSKNLLT